MAKHSIAPFFFHLKTTPILNSTHFYWSKTFLWVSNCIFIYSRVIKGFLFTGLFTTPVLHKKAQCRNTWAGPSGQSGVVPRPDCSSHRNTETGRRCTPASCTTWGLLTACWNSGTAYSSKMGTVCTLCPHGIIHSCFLGCQANEVPQHSKPLAQLVKLSVIPTAKKPAATKHRKEQKPYASGLNPVLGLGIKNTDFQGNSKHSVLVS